MLGTIALVKARVGIPDTDTSHDTAATGLLRIVTGYILERVRMSETGGVQSEVFTDVRLGRRLVLPVRPVDAASAITVSGKLHGDSVISTLEYDLFNAAEGRIVIIPTGFGAIWPENLRQSQSKWYQHRRWVWDVLTVSYTALAMPALDKALLDDIAVEYAAFLLDKGTGAISKQTIGPLVNEYLDRALPRHLQGLLSRWTKTERAALWV